MNKQTKQNQVAIITGGSSGVGKECAAQLCAQGAQVVIVGSNSAKVEAVVSELGEQAQGLAGDVRQSSFAEQVFQYASQTFTTPTLLINSAGTILRQTASNTNDADWQRVLDVNVNGVFYFSRVFAQQAQSGSAIVNVSSTCGQVGAAGLAAYCASKGAVDQLTRTMALELAEQGITVNAVAPGAINSPMLYSKRQKKVTMQDVVSSNLASIPVGALAEAEEVARAILFLASERHITGTVLSIDGGYTAA